MDYKDISQIFYEPKNNIYWKYTMLSNDELLHYNIDEYYDDMDHRESYFMMDSMIFFLPINSKNSNNKHHIYQIKKTRMDEEKNCCVEELSKYEKRIILKKIVFSLMESIVKMEQLLYDKTYWNYKIILNRNNLYLKNKKIIKTKKKNFRINFNDL